MVDVNKALSAAAKTGKLTFGASEALNSARTGKGRLILVASNSLRRIRQEIEFYGALSQVPVISYRSTNTDLGLACGKKFPVSVVTVKEPGDSEILQLADEAKENSAATESSEDH